MDEIIIRELQQTATAEEVDELARWRKASAEHERRYQEVRALWAMFGVRREIDTEREVPSASLILRPAESSIPTPGPRRRGLGSRRRVAVAVSVAASLAAGLALGIGYVGDTADDGPPVRTAEFRTGSNDLTTAVLDDGSVARLAPNTLLRATMSDDERHVELDGRAFFATARDADRPFVVRTPEGEARVLGTRFEIDSSRGGLRLLVVDGRVAMSAGGGEAELEAGDLGRSVPDASPTVTRVEAPEALLTWMGSWVAFESTPLDRVAQELEIRLGIGVDLADPVLAERTISGWFSERDRELMLQMICRVADVTCTRMGERVRIEP